MSMVVKGQRICDGCRHFFNKSELKINMHGQFCNECYKKSVKKANLISNINRRCQVIS